MLGVRWVAGLVRRRPGRIVGLTVAVAMAVLLTASLGAFFSASRSRMTADAVASVPVDWQVQLTPGTDVAKATSTVAATGGILQVLPVGYADTTSLRSSVGGTVQTTGPGVALGLPAGYAAAFPGEIRPLIGAQDGVLLAQQAAANLGVTVGADIAIGRPGAPPAHVTVNGVVDLPAADSLFQAIGAAPGFRTDRPAGQRGAAARGTVLEALPRGSTRRHDAAPRRARSNAPGGPRRGVRPGRGSSEEPRGCTLRVRTDRRQPGGSPRRRPIRRRLCPAPLPLPRPAGGGARGAPRGRRFGGRSRTPPPRAGTAAHARRRDRARSCVSRPPRRWPSESMASLLGLGAAVVAGHVAFGASRFGATTTQAWAWTAMSVVVGIGLALITIVVPAASDARLLTVGAARATIGRGRRPLWMRLYVDVALLAAGGLVYWQAVRSGYAVVLAPEGVPTISISTFTLMAPALFWSGAALFAWRLCSTTLGRGRSLIRRAAHPVAKGMSGVVASSMSRQRRSIARATILMALTASFALTVAVFNATYAAQAKVDAQLTNGADVSAMTTNLAGLPAGIQAQAATLPGVASATTMQHRFAYVGNDLQDLYGIDPATIGATTPMSDAFFGNGDAAATLATLAAQSRRRAPVR